MPDKLKELFDDWNSKQAGADDFTIFQAAYTMSAVSMRSRAQALAQKKKGNDLINAIGALPDIAE